MRLGAASALGRLRRMGKPVLTTGDAALHLGLSRSAASRALARLAGAGLVLPVRRGLWSLEMDVDPIRLPEHLTAPFPAYVSLQSALHLHGLIRQVPHTVYVASLAPTRRIRTRLGEFSVHRLAPAFFGGFVTTKGGVRLASPEKALLDVLYLTPARSRLFAALPEIEIPRRFDRKAAWAWVVRIAPGPRREAVRRRLQVLLHDGSTASNDRRRTSLKIRR